MKLEVRNGKWEVRTTRKTAMLSLFLALSSLLLALSSFDVAYGLDPKHNAPITCDSCHVAHSSLGGGMTNADSNANLCLSCHTSPGMAGKKPFVDSMKGTPGGTPPTGTSHTWDAVVYNPGRGTDYPTNPELILRLDPIIRGAAVENSADSVGLRNLSANYIVDQYKDKMIQFYGYSVQAVGTATGGSGTGVEDSGANWDTNRWAKYYVGMKSGANAGQRRKITSNTATVLTAEAFTGPVGAGDAYEIINPSYGNSGALRKITKNTENSLEFEAFPIAPLKDDKYVIMGSYRTGEEQKLIDGGKITEKDVLITRFSCSTCHNQHLQQGRPWSPYSDGEYVAGATSNRKFLRIDNERSQICVDCHRNRMSGTATETRVWHEGQYKSHPVGKGLTEAANPLQFREKPLDRNYAEQGGGRYELNGAGDSNATNNLVFSADKKVQCLTCHGIHFTDSDSTTEDKP